MSLRKSSVILLSSVALTSVTLVGCSSSSSSTAPSSPVAATSAAPMPSFTGANAQFCNAMAAAEEAGANLEAAREDGNSAAETTAAQQFLTSLQASLAALPADAPAELKTDLQQTVTMLQSEEAQGSSSPNPSSSAAGEKLDAALQAYVPKACPEMANAG